MRTTRIHVLRNNLGAVSNVQTAISSCFKQMLRSDSRAKSSAIAWPQVTAAQDGLLRLLAQRPQSRGVGQANSATPQPVIPAETGRVREGDPATDVVEWID